MTPAPIQRGIIYPQGGGASGPLSIAPRGTAQNKGVFGSLAIPAVVCTGGALIFSVCYSNAGGPIDTVDWGGAPLSLIRQQPTGVNSSTEIWALYGLAANTFALTVTIPLLTTAMAMCVSEVNNLAASPEDKQAGASGSSGSPSSGATAVTALAKELWWGAIGTEGPGGDAAGAWSNGFNAGQRIGTTGGVATTNATIGEGSLIVAATGAATAAKTGMTVRAWGAIIQTLKGN
jgi:hypothetical protein